MKLKSEVRQPGMKAEPRCIICRALLDGGGDMRCAECTLPRVNMLARVLGARRRAAEAEIENGIKWIKQTIRAMEGEVDTWPTPRRPRR